MLLYLLRVSKQEVKRLLHRQFQQVQPADPEFLLPVRSWFPMMEQTLKPSIHIYA